MEKRTLGRTGRDVSVVGLGCWQLGADWGSVSEDAAMSVLHAAVDAGVTFLDTADVYGDGRSEALIGRLLRERPDAGLTVATKAYDESTTFAPDDHRSFNRNGEAFDVGETFSGVPYEVGVRAAQEVARHTPEVATTAQLALRWVVDQPGVSTVIPGARDAVQARANAAAAGLPPLSAEVQDALRRVYDERTRGHVHDRW